MGLIGEDQELSNHSLLLFDLDETLLSSSWFEAGMIRTLGLHPFTRTLDASLFLEKKLNVPKPLLEQFKSRELTPLEFKRARWRHAFAYFNLFPELEVIDEIDELFLKTGMDCIEENDSVTRLLNDLRKTFRLGIVTNALYDAHLKISQMGLSSIFSTETIFQAEKLGYRKPDPEIYSAALDHFGKKPNETIFVGDSWVHDVVGAMDVGMEAIWVNSKGLSQTTSHIPYAVVSDITELRDILHKRYQKC